MIQFKFSEENRVKTSVMERSLIQDSSFHGCVRTDWERKSRKGGIRRSEEQP